MAVLIVEKLTPLSVLNCGASLSSNLINGVELWTLNPSILINLERCQVWFLKKVLHFPKFAHNLFVLKVYNMCSIQSEIDHRKLLFFCKVGIKRARKFNI